MSAHGSLSLALAVSSAAICAQSQFLADLNNNLGMAGSSTPGSFLQLGNEVYFAATSPFVGRELWVADRTNGARLFADIIPGASGSSPTAITAWGQGLAFLADLGQGQQPYYIALTSRTVRSLLGPSRRLNSVSRLTVSGAQLFFVADDGVNGAELWVASSPANSAQPVADIRPGASAQFAAMVPFRNGVAMIADDGVHGYELWVSDGTTAGTRMVRDLNPGAAWGASNTPPVVFGNELYFSGDDGASGGELFAFDGTSLRLVADLVPGASGSFPQLITVAAGRLAFLAGDGVTTGRRPAISDGTTAGTRFVAGVGAAANLVSDAGGRLMVLTEVPRDLAVIDAGASTARLLRLPLFTFTSVMPRMASAGSRVYFEIPVGTSSRTQLWTSDGTTAGSGVVVDATLSGAGFAAGYADGSMLVALHVESSGHELWLSDGTVSGTRLFADLDPSRPTLDSRPVVLGEVGGRAVLRLNSGLLAATDGTVRNTGLVRATGVSSIYSMLTELNDALLLFESIGSRRLLRTDGTPSGTVVVADVAPMIHSSASPIGVALDGARVVFGGTDDGMSGQLWITDGTAAGTRMLRRFDTSGRFPPYGFVKVGAEVFFFGYDGTARLDLWATDGTAAGTRILTALPQAAQYPRMLGAVDGKAVFVSDSQVTWVSDGTAAGTQVLLAGSVLFEPSSSVVAGNRLLIPTYSQGVLATDGTPAGTAFLLGTRGGEQIVGMGDFAYVVRSATPAVFLRTDGTAAGTTPVPVTLPVGAIALRRVSDNSFALGVADPRGGPGLLLVCDGTGLGTRVVTDNYMNGRIGVVDGGVVYAGTDARHGVEPWFVGIGATAQAVGLGCGNGHVPTLRASEPRLGQQMTLRGAQLGVASVLLLGEPAFTPLRLALPTSGCSAFLASIAAAVAVPSSGDVRFVVPPGSELVGARVAAQLVSVDATLSLALSNGVRLTPGL